MSMIYECPTCHVPQAAGRTSCQACGAEFDGAVPDDALVPEATEAAPAPVLAVAQSDPPVAAPAPEPGMPRLEAVPTPPAPPAPYPPPTYQPPPAAYPPPPEPVYAANAPAQRSGITLPRALLVAIPVVLALVLGAVFFTRNPDSGSEASPSPPPVSSPLTAMSAPASAPAPVGSPVTLSGGAASSQSGSGLAKWLAGRWQAKSTDYYVFHDNGTGERGSVTGKQTSDSFVWVLSQTQMTLYLADTQEKLALSPGTDDSTLFLRGADGRYVEYVRTKTGA